MENTQFTLELESGFMLHKKGLQATDILQPLGIEGTEIHIQGGIEIEFSLNEVNNSLLLTKLFKEKNVADLECEGGEFNSLVDLGKLFEKGIVHYSYDRCGSECLVSDYKEKFFNIINELLKKDSFMNKNKELQPFREKEEKPKKYFSQLDNFNSHEWVKFYEDEQGQPNVEWKEGCHDRGLDGLRDFEGRLQEEYTRDTIPFRTYAIEDEKMRLAMGLPVSNLMNPPKDRFIELLESKKDVIQKYIEEQAKNIAEDEYAPKNVMWFGVALQAIEGTDREFEYLADNQEPDEYDNDDDRDDYYYDLVTEKYLGQSFAIPVPVLARVLEVEEEDIAGYFDTHPDRQNVEFI